MSITNTFWNGICIRACKSFSLTLQCVWITFQINMRYITYWRIAWMRMDVARKKRSTTSGMNLSYYEPPVSSVDRTPSTISFPSSQKRINCKTTVWGWMILIWHSHLRSGYDMSDTVSWSTVLRVDHVHDHPVAANSPQEADSGNPYGDSFIKKFLKHPGRSLKAIVPMLIYLSGT